MPKFTPNAARQRDAIRSNNPHLEEEMLKTEAGIDNANPHPPPKSGENVEYTCIKSNGGYRVTKVELMRSVRIPGKNI